MHKFIEEIKEFETKPFIVNNFFNKEEIELLQKLYYELPIEIDNKRQKIIKKKWPIDFNKELQIKYTQKLKEVIGDYEMDNPDTRGRKKKFRIVSRELHACHTACRYWI